jgi:UDP-N-acetylmuramate dehydrogenase
VAFEAPEENVPLAPLTTLGVGGTARWLARVSYGRDVARAYEWAAARRAPVFVLGGGSNVVVADRGFPGLVLQIRGTRIGTPIRRGDDVFIDAAAGGSWDAFVAFTVDRGLAGIECLSGIPGTVGGTPIQNVGAYGQEVAHVIECVEVFDVEQQSRVVLSAADCEFGYRMSRFKARDAGRFVVCFVMFRFRPGAPTIRYPELADYLAQKNEPADLAGVRAAVLAIRARKGMVLDDADSDTRSVGSFFMNPVVSRATFERIAAAAASGADPAGPRVPHFMMDNDNVKIPAAWLIERTGFSRGHVDGPAGVSTKHPLAIINRGGATARDVIRLARRIKEAVNDWFGIALRPEPVFVGFDDDPDVQYLRG